MCEGSEDRAEPRTCFCNNCSHDWMVGTQVRLKADPAGAGRSGGRWATLDDLVARTGLRRDELVTLADIGALNSFGYDRRSALWQGGGGAGPRRGIFTNTTRAEVAGE